MQTLFATLLWSLAFLATSGLTLWCLRVEPAAHGQGRRGVRARMQDMLALLLIGAVVLLAAPSPAKWEPANWLARRSHQATHDKAQARALKQARESLQALDQRLAVNTEPLKPEGGAGANALVPVQEGPFPWRDMTEAEADLMNRASVEGFDRDLAERRLLTEQSSAVKHHCQYRLWRSNGADESRPVAVLTFLPEDHLHELRLTAAYAGGALAHDGTKLTLNLLGGQVANGDASAFGRVLGQLLATDPPLRVTAQDLSGSVPMPMRNGQAAISMKLDSPMEPATFNRVVWARVAPATNGRLLLALRTTVGLLYAEGRPAPEGANDEEKLAKLTNFLRGTTPAKQWPAESDLGYAVAIEPGSRFTPSSPIEVVTLTPMSQEYDAWLRTHPDGAGQGNTVVMALKSVQRGPNALIRHSTNFNNAPELTGRLRCTDAPPGQLAAVLQWLGAATPR